MITDIEQAAEKYASNKWKDGFTMNKQETVYDFKAGAVWQQSQQPKEADGWISVEDRLPDYKADPRPVLCLYNNGNMEVSYHLNHCTHWQPLPLPPKK